MKKIIFTFLLAAVCLALFILFPLIRERYFVSTEKNGSVLPRENISYFSGRFEESAAYFSVPFCGFYHIYGFVLKDETVYPSVEDVPLAKDSESEEQLELLQINLCRFADAPLTETALSQLDLILAAHTSQGKQLILRFLYDWDGKGLQSEPKNLETILQHIRQTASVYNRYRDHIFLIQGLSTGSYGEMHSTSYYSDEDLRRLFQTLADAADESIYLSVRTPAHWRAICGADDPDKAGILSSPYSRRLGLYNDGMLASPTDLGTYPENMRDSELAFQDILCQNVPNGGEIIYDNPCNDLPNAISDLSKMHVSYLNSAYDTAVYNKWKQSVIHSDDCYNGMNGYDYIRLHLGYRYVLRRTALLSDGCLTLSIENTGFSPSYKPLSLIVSVLSEEGRTVSEYRISSAEKLLPGGKISDLSVPLDTSTLSSGRYHLSLRAVSDVTGETIPFANTLTPSEEGYPIGSLDFYRLTHNIPKKSRPSSDSFAR